MNHFDMIRRHSFFDIYNSGYEVGQDVHNGDCDLLLQKRASRENHSSIVKRTISFSARRSRIFGRIKGAFLTLTERSRHRIHLDVCSLKHLLLRCIS
jgi:hypothetical protein